MGGGKSSSSSAVDVSTTTAQTTGGSGSDSPTVSAGGAVTINSAGGAVSLTALERMNDVVQSALNLQSGLTGQSLGLLSDFNARQAASLVTASKADTDLLSSVLANNQTLAENVQSGGATTGMGLTTKVVMGALALMGLLIATVLFRKK